MSEQAKEQSVDVVDHLPGEERGIPSVNDVAPSRAKRTLIAVALLLVVAMFAALGYWKYQRKVAQQHAAETKKDLQLSSAVPARTFVDAPAEAAPPLPGAAASGAAAGGAVPVVPAPGAGAAPPLPGSAGASTGAGQGAAGAAAVRPRVLDKAESSLMAGGEKNSAPADRTPAGPGAAPFDAGQSGGGGMAAMLNSTQTPARSAGMLGNRNFVLAKGSFIDCALQTRLDSTVPGMTACVVTRDIFSDNGAVKLIEKGSTITGEYQSNLKQGMARIFVLWSRIKTTKGVVVNLDSPATDALGGAGLSGHVDTHFWQRFGGAILLSLVDDLGSAVAASVGGQGRNQQFNFNGTGAAASDVAAETLKHTINIPPTLTKEQGERVGVYVARDLDFSGVYDVAAQ